MSSPMAAPDPKRTALLVMDFQQGIVQRIPGLDPLLGRVQQAIAGVSRGGRRRTERIATAVDSRP
jgi:nicotinamidase-related amidase